MRRRVQDNLSRKSSQDGSEKRVTAIESAISYIRIRSSWRRTRLRVCLKSTCTSTPKLGRQASQHGRWAVAWVGLNVYTCERVATQWLIAMHPCVTRDSSSEGWLSACSTSVRTGTALAWPALHTPICSVKHTASCRPAVLCLCAGRLELDGRSL